MSNLRKVLLVGPVPPPLGGIASYVHELSKSQIENVEFSVFNTSFPQWVVPPDREGKRSYFSIFEGGIFSGIKKVFFVIWSFGKLFYILLKTKPDIIQVFPSSFWAYWRNLTYLFEAKLLGFRTIFHVLNAIDVFYKEVGKLQKKLIIKSLSLPDFILVQSPKLESFVQSLSKKKVKGIFNGIHLDKVPQNKTAHIPLPIIEGCIGVTVGNLSKNKGTYLILESLKILKTEGISVRWVFIGRGNFQGFLDKAKACGIEDQLVFTGLISDEQKWNYLHTSDFYCLPSYAEGQPISIIEAMAVGLPIISTTIGSIPEMIRENENGYLIPPGDSLALSDAIKKMITDPIRMKQMGVNNKLLCQSRFDATVMFYQISRVYDELIQV